MMTSSQIQVNKTSTPESDIIQGWQVMIQEEHDCWHDMERDYSSRDLLFDDVFDISLISLWVCSLFLAILSWKNMAEIIFSVERAK